MLRGLDIFHALGRAWSIGCVEDPARSKDLAARRDKERWIGFSRLIAIGGRLAKGARPAALSVVVEASGACAARIRTGTSPPPRTVAAERCRTPNRRARSRSPRGDRRPGSGPRRSATKARDRR